jgi:hypothetical protein
MKKLLLLFTAAVLLLSCQTKPQQYFTSCSEIDIVKTTNAAYNAGDWKKMRASFADTAKILNNTWTMAEGMSADDFIKALETGAGNYSSYKIADDAIYEMVVNDAGEKWVHNWFLWSGIHKNGKDVKMPIHLSFRMVDNKIAFQVCMFNALPGYLAAHPEPIAVAETTK